MAKKIREYKRLKGTKLINELKSVIDQHEQFKGSYFWTPPGSASARRSYEARNSREQIVFKYNGHEYEINQDVSCSCKNVYYEFSVLVDGEKKTIAALKKLLK